LGELKRSPHPIAAKRGGREGKENGREKRKGWGKGRGKGRRREKRGGVPLGENSGYATALSL